MTTTSDLHVVETRPLVPPGFLHQDFPIDFEAANTVALARKRIKTILSGQDFRLLVIVGPCSVHDIEAAKEYANRLKLLRERFSEKLEMYIPP